MDIVKKLNIFAEVINTFRNKFIIHVFIVAYQILLFEKIGCVMFRGFVATLKNMN